MLINIIWSARKFWNYALKFNIRNFQGRRKRRGQGGNCFFPRPSTLKDFGLPLPFRFISFLPTALYVLLPVFDEFFWRIFWRIFLTIFLTKFKTNFLTKFFSESFHEFFLQIFLEDFDWPIIFKPLQALGLEYLQSCFFHNYRMPIRFYLLKPRFLWW